MLNDGFRVRAARRRGKLKTIIFGSLQFKKRLYPTPCQLITDNKQLVTVLTLQVVSY